MTDDKIAKAMLTDDRCSMCKNAKRYEDVGGYVIESECISRKLTGGEGCNKWKLDDGKKYVRV